MTRRFLLLLVYESISQFMKNNVLKENKGILFLFESLFASTFTFLIIQSIFDLMEKAEQHITSHNSKARTPQTQLNTDYHAHVVLKQSAY